MTKEEAFLNVVQVGSVDESTAQLYLLSSKINGEDEYTGDLAELEKCAIPCLQSLLIVTSQSEGSWSEGRDREGIKSRLLFLAKKHGDKSVLNELTPTIKRVRKW
ncbi:DUF6706 family protein [Sphingobacterium faecium]|uniref:DUF6706 family protein n=1 Tax=Sphingobacterium faecium TaxID=34087 RepID=UPI00247912CF|nr:DUF6706 family protein [Sphingobacterium faecium]WGQ15578.1 hypothetical protein QG727_04020 [Sphingobacterium faecium]